MVGCFAYLRILENSPLIRVYGIYNGQTHLYALGILLAYNVHMPISTSYW
jgi:hypothetical protein